MYGVGINILNCFARRNMDVLNLRIFAAACVLFGSLEVVTIGIVM